MRHEERRDADLELHAPDLIAQAAADLGVERGQRLVEQQDLGLDGESARQRDTLLLATRQLVREAVGVAGKTDELEHLV